MVALLIHYWPIADEPPHDGPPSQMTEMSKQVDDNIEQAMEVTEMAKLLDENIVPNKQGIVQNKQDMEVRLI